MNGNQTPKRLRHAIILALGMGVSHVALSLGLGPINVKSYLGQPMFATIRVDGLNASTAKSMTVRLADPAAYKARGIEMLSEHQQLRFALVPSGKGYVIRVTSLGSIKEPFINFLLSVSGNGNAVTREYAAFFNPDPAMEAAGITGKSGTSASHKDTFSAAKNIADNKEKPQNPVATSGWGGKKTVTKARKPEPAQQATSTTAVSPTPDSIPVGASYGPVKPGETLYSIANAARPSDDISVHDMMRLIYNANRRAFSRGDMGSLMAGVSLYIPSPGNTNNNTQSAAPMPGKHKTESATVKKQDNSTASSHSEEQTTPAAGNEDSEQQKTGEDENKVADAVSQTPGSAAAQLVLGSDSDTQKTQESGSAADNTQASAETATDNNNDSLKAEDANTASGQNDSLTLDMPESVAPAQATENNSSDNVAGDNAAAGDTESGENKTATETEVPPPVVAVPEQKQEDNAVTSTASDTSVATEQPTPAPAEQKSVQPVVSTPVQSEPEEKSSFALSIPLLAGGVALLLALAGLAGFLWRKRKRKQADTMEEFSQEEIDRMVAEMEDEHGGLDFDSLSAAIENHTDNVSDPTMSTALAEDTADFAVSDNNSDHNDGIFSDDFFEDMEVSSSEHALSDGHGFGESGASAATAAVSLDKSDEGYAEDDFFADLEFNENGASVASAEKHTAENPAEETALSETDDDIDFLSDLDSDPADNSRDKPVAFEDSEDDFFADEPVKPQAAEDDLDFFDENIAEPPVASQVKEEEASSDGLDFFLDEFSEKADNAENAIPESVETVSETSENNVDFFMEDDDTSAESDKTQDKGSSSAVVDFFMEEEDDASAGKEKSSPAEEDSAGLDFLAERDDSTTSAVSSAISTEAEVDDRVEAELPSDIQNLFDDEEESTESTAAATDKKQSAATVEIDAEAMEINLDMATSFIAMGKNEKARSWLEEVLDEGTEEQKERAKAMLAQIKKG